jgi:regulator of RNase E activity RraA
MTPGPGFRVKKSFPRLAKDIIQGFSDFETPDISDILNRLYTMSSGIRNVVSDEPLIGLACTVKVYPGDNLMVHKALDIAQPGDVIVVDAGGFTANAVFGDLVATKAKHRGIAGFIIDGLTRDLPGLKRVGLPVFAKGVSPIGPLHRGPGEVNYSISCGGIVVNPGDLVVADLNGIAVVRSDFAKDILERLRLRSAALRDYIAAVERGDFSNEWVDRELRNAGCETQD